MRFLHTIAQSARSVNWYPLPDDRHLLMHVTLISASIVLGLGALVLYVMVIVPASFILVVLEQGF